MSRIFVSYSRDNHAVVRSLVGDLDALGHSTWFDEELSGGQMWWDEVLGQIRECQVFVLAVSPATLNSTACKREYGYAEDLGKPILPIVVAPGISTNLLPPALSKVQLVNYLHQDRGEALRLARAISALPAPQPLPIPLPAPPDVPVSYLGQLSERIETVSTLAYPEQSALLLDLRRGMLDPETRHDSRTLLERLRKRRDLFAAIAEEIDASVRITPLAGAPALAAHAVATAPAMSPGAVSPSFDVPALPVGPPPPAANRPPDFAPPAVTRAAALNVPAAILLLLVGPIGWAIALRHRRRDVVLVLVTTPFIYVTAGLFMANGDGIDGYSDDLWEYIGALLLFATWWWPFARASFRARVLRRRDGADLS